MIIVISPAKTLDFESPVKTKKHSQPVFLDDSEKLINTIRDLTPEDISELMNISPALGELNFRRFANWQRPFSLDNARQAVFAFRGDVYAGLDADSLSAADLDYAQKHLRILSGLYGVLRPLDLIQPYRLEMGIRLAVPEEDARNLYDFWDNAITRQLNEELKPGRSPVLINLASQEYFKSVQTKKLEAEVVTPAFKDYKNGKYKIISFYAKKARGQMASWIIRQRISKREQLEDFAEAGYRYSPEESTAAKPVFLRDEVKT